MKKLVVKDIQEYGLYILKDTNSDNEFEIVLDFHKMDKAQIGDIFVMHNDYLFKTSEFFSKMYSFEPAKEITAKNVIDDNLRDFIVLGSHKKNYVLRRIYG